MIFNPTNWYWVVSGSTTQVWSSARVQYIPVTDATYQAWLLQAGNSPSQVLPGELLDVLLNVWAPSVQSSGVTVTSTSTPAINGLYDIDPVSLSKISGLATGIAAGRALPGGGLTFNYPDASNTMHAFNNATFMDLAAAIEGFIYNFEQALYSLVNGQPATLPAPTLSIL